MTDTKKTEKSLLN